MGGSREALGSRTVASGGDAEGAFPGLPVDRAQVAGAQGVQEAQRFVGAPADVAVADRGVPHDPVGVDH